MQSPDSPFFSVVIPVFNRPDYLRAAIESVRAQTWADYEIIVVDDGSTDDGVAQLLNEHRSSVRSIHQENAGQAVARNRAAAEAKGKYLAFLDSDDVWYPHTLATFADLINQYDQPSMLMGLPVDWDDQTPVPVVEAAEPQADAYPRALDAPLGDGFVGSCVMVVDRAAFQRVGGFIEVRHNGEDLDLLLRLSVEPGFVWVRQPATLAYRAHDGNSIKQSASTV
ncbi:MAG: glycosyltransferase family A protein, partial [Planctomycetota bacterium]